MLRYLIRRLLLLIPTLIGILTLVFIMLEAIPGDPAVALAGDKATPAQLDAIRKSYGLDRPILVQYLYYLKSAVTFDFGRSLRTHQPVTHELHQFFGATIEQTFIGGFIFPAVFFGLLFLVPGSGTTLRVNGRAEISQDPALLTPLTVQNVTPTIGIKVHVEECYFHCGKALMRSKLWSPDAQVERHSFPSLGRIIAEQTAAITVDAAEKTMEEAYRTRLY